LLYKKLNLENQQPNNPLHGIKLAYIVEYLFNEYGWQELGRKIKINSFTKDPSIKSSLKFLRKTDWARKEVEELFLKTKRNKEKLKDNKKDKPQDKSAIINSNSEIKSIIKKSSAKKFTRKK